MSDVWFEATERTLYMTFKAIASITTADVTEREDSQNAMPPSTNELS